MRKLKRYPKKLSLGGLAIAGQVIGGVANMFIGAKQRKDGKAKAKEGRENYIGSLGASDALASFTDENKILANEAGDLADEKSDSALAGVLAANKAGDPRFMSTIGVNEIAGAEQDRGLKTAQGIAAAGAPLVQAEEKAKDQMTALYGQDTAEGKAAFQQGTQNMMGGASNLLNMPTDLLTAQTAGADFSQELDLGKHGGLFGKEKSYAAGGLIGMGGMSMKGFEHMGKTGSDEKIDKVKEVLDDYKSPRGRKTKGSSYDFRNETLDVDAPTHDSIDIGKMIHEATMKRKQNPGKPSTEDYYEEGSGYGPRDGKEGGYFNNEYAEGGFMNGLGEGNDLGSTGFMRQRMASGGTIQQLIAEGGSFTTPGEEDHDEQEFDIVDSETGETVAKTTGQERHEDSEDGMSVTNSDQDQGMRDAFLSVRDKKNPTLEELRMLYEANHRVYSQPKFA